MDDIRKKRLQIQKEISEKFLSKFNNDKRPRGAKLKEIGLARGTYITIKRQRALLMKSTVETMCAYLENRRPKWEGVRPGIEFYCYSCETIKPILKQCKYDRWTCQRCKNLMVKKSIWKNHDRRLKELERRRNYKLKKKYGTFWQAIRLSVEIRDNTNKRYAKKEDK